MTGLSPRASLSGVVAFSLLVIVGGTSITSAEEPAAPAPTSFFEALREGKPALQLRYRLESVDDDASTKDAWASTLRTVLGYSSASYRGWSVFAEAENVTVLGNELYNNRGAGALANGITDRPVVADPEITEINQAGVRYRSDEWSATIGRQEILLGDLRYVGNVGWRQNHQSFDAVRIDNSSIARAGFGYAYVDRVHRIFGDSLDLSAHLAEARVVAGGAGKLTLYGYLLDYREPQAAGLSTATWGAELTGKREISQGRSLLWELEYARQHDHADNPADVDAGYAFVMAGAAWPAITVRLGWELLEGAPGEGRFTTPLATLHKYNGWADQFLVTPADGLVDLYLQIGANAGGVEWLARYHDFSADSGGADYGTELDLQLTYPTPHKVTLGLKAALYDADTFSVDTAKVMAWAAWSF